MRILKEIIDDDIFIDLILDPKDVEQIHEQSIEPQAVNLGPLTINLWVRTATQRELYDEAHWTDDE